MTLLKQRQNEIHGSLRAYTCNICGNNRGVNRLCTWCRTLPTTCNTLKGY